MAGENDRLVKGLGDGDMQLVKDFEVVDSDGTVLFKVDTSGNVTADGTITGGGVGGTPGGTSGAVQFNDAGTFGGEAANLFYDSTNNRLGVGTNAPASNLDVVGGASIDNALVGEAVIGTDLTGGLTVNRQFQYQGTNALEGAGKVLTSDADGNASWQTPSAGSPAGANTEVQYNDSGAFGASPRMTFDSAVGHMTITNESGTNALTIVPKQNGSDAALEFADAFVSQTWQLYYESSSKTLNVRNASNPLQLMTFDDTNKVGINNQSPSTELDVSGTINAIAYSVGTVAGASGGPFTTITGITVVNGIVTAISGT